MKRITAAVLSALFVLAGCGGGADGSQQASQASAASSPESYIIRKRGKTAS